MHLKKISGVLLAAACVLTGACGDSGVGSNGGESGVRKAEEVAGVNRATGPLPDNAFKASISLMNPPVKMRPGQKETLQVKVKNVSDTAWPARGRSGDGHYQVNLGNAWYDNKNTRLNSTDYVRSGFPADLKPGEEVEVPLVITAPNAAGDYTLEIDLVQEMVSWFSKKGSEAPKFKIKVE